MEFLNWLFNDHWIISLLFMPFLQLAWAYYHGLKFRLLVAAVAYVVMITIRIAWASRGRE